MTDNIEKLHYFFAQSRRVKYLHFIIRQNQTADFIAFLKAKGFKAKLRLVIEGIKRGAANASKSTAAQIAKVKADTAASVARAGVGTQAAPTEISAEELAAEFNKYLAKRGLDGKFTLTVVEE